MKLEQKWCVQNLGKSLQKVNSLSHKNIKRKICRREQKIAELKVANKQTLIKLHEAFLNEEKLKEEVLFSTHQLKTLNTQKRLIIQISILMNH